MMKLSIRPLLIAACLLPSAWPGALVAQDDAADPSATLNAVRAAVAGRDLPQAREKLAEAKRQSGDAQFAAERERLDELVEYVGKFWSAVDQGIKTLDAPDELMIGDQLTAVVEVGNGFIILRVAGRNREYTHQNMPAKVALTLAERVLKPEAAQNKVFFGAFLALDARGDRQIARQMWDDAQRGGVDVKRLLPELEIEPPPPPIEIPPLTPAIRAALSDKNWSLRVPTEKGWLRRTLDDAGKQNREGRLEIVLPEEEDRYQVVTRRPFAAEFQVRMIVVDVPKGSSFGLFSAEGEDLGYVVDLPAGTLQIDFVRRATGATCKISGREAEVRKLGEPRARLTGNVGLLVPGGSKFTIASFEFAGR